MAYLATRRFNYWTQLGILTMFWGGGWIFGAFVSLVPIMERVDFHNFSASLQKIMDNLISPENATVLRWMQFISTLFVLFLPPVFYAWVCHKKPFVHLGFKNRLNIGSVGIVLLIMLAAVPMVSLLQDLTEMLPWSKAMRLRFKLAEDEYTRTVDIMARMNNFKDYLISVFIVAFLPAIFEETLFRGGIQNLLSRWLKMPVIAIVISAIIFSAVHGSYLGFLSRFALGFVLGWIYYRTGNIWLNILAHFFNNVFAVTALYLASKPGEKIDATKIDDRFPIWIGLISIAAVYGLFIAFEKISREEIVHPGEELPMPGVAYTNDPFLNDVFIADTKV